MKYARQTLFYAVIVIFIATAVVTLLGVTGMVAIEATYLNTLFAALIVELVAAVIGLFKSTDWFGAKSALPEDSQILGGWWQFLRQGIEFQGSKNVVSFIKIRYADAQQQYLIEGDAYTAEGKPFASWWSVAAAFNVATNELWYIYAGDHESSADDAKSVGYLKFSRPAPGEKPNRGVGWFVNGNIEQLTIETKTKIELLPADRQEFAAMSSDDTARSEKGKIAASVYAQWADVKEPEIQAAGGKMSGNGASVVNS